MFAESFGEITTKVDMRTKEKEIVVKHQSDKLFTDVGIPKESVKSIIFGVRTTEKGIKDILEIVSENDYKCKLYQMKMRDGCMIREQLN